MDNSSGLTGGIRDLSTNVATLSKGFILLAASAQKAAAETAKASTTVVQTTAATLDKASQHMADLYNTVVQYSGGIALNVGQTLQNLAGMLELEKQMLHGKVNFTGTQLVQNEADIQKLVGLIQKLIDPNFNLQAFQQYLSKQATGGTTGATTAKIPGLVSGTSAAGSTGSAIIGGITPASVTSLQSRGTLP